MVRVSALCSGFRLFFKSQPAVCCLFNFNIFVKLLPSCFLGWENPAFTILKNKSWNYWDVGRLSFCGVILIIAESTLGEGQKQFLET